MTRPHVASGIPLALLASLLLLPFGAAHTAAPPPDYQTRLLHDCNDDYYGGDSGIGSDRPGHDLHALDLQEAWSSALGDHLVFRLILNGNDNERITVALDADGSSKSYDFVRSGGSWGGSFDEVRRIKDIGDDPRFALEGAVRLSTLGVASGDMISEYTVTGRSGDEEHDHIPGNDATIGGCQDNFRRPDYEIEGPVQYVGSSFEEEDVQVEAGKEKFVTLSIKSETRDAAQTATVTVDGSGAQVRLHDPGTGDYVSEAEFDLSKRGTQGGDAASIHVAIEGDAPDSGSATVTVTTSMGGRITDTLDFGITQAAGGSDTAGTTETTSMGSEESPGLPLVAVLTGLAALALAARRR